jgi:phosphate-selective porin OprO/OprP
MNKRWSKVLAAGAGTATLGLANPAQALTDSQRLEKLEQHIERLERRLEQSEHENAKLKKEIAGDSSAPQQRKARSGLAYRLGYEEEAPAPRLANQQEFKALDTKVKLLERKLEVDEEVASNDRKKNPKIEAGQNGFKIGTADGDWQLRLRGFLQADTNTFLEDTLPPGEGIGWNPLLGDNGAPNPFTGGAGLASDKFIIRRARLQFAGTLAKDWDFLIAPDFGGGQARLFDAWADMHYWQPASFAIGKMKGPQDLERLQTATNLLFNERAYPTQLAPNRQIGAMLHGELEGPGFDTKYISNISHTQELFSYQLGIFNGSQDNQAVQNSDTTNFDNKAYMGRVFAHPFRHVEWEPIQRLGLGFAGNFTSWEGQNGQTPIASLVSQGQSNIVNYQGPQIVPSAGNTSVTEVVAPITGSGTATNQRVITTQATTTLYSGAFLDGSQYHFAPQGYWYWGPFGLMADWTSSTQGLGVNQSSTTITTRASDTSPTTNNATGGQTPGQRVTTVTTQTTAPNLGKSISQTNLAWQVAASYVLTGEDNTYWAIKPRENFNPFEGKWGAWQLAFRWHELDIDKDTFTNYGTASNQLYLFSDPRSSIQHASTWGVGVNWFLNSNVSIKGNYEQTTFTGGAVTDTNQVADRPDEKVFFTRVQFWY